MGEEAERGRPLGNGCELECPPGLGLDAVKQGGVEGGFRRDEVVVVEEVGVSEEREAIALELKGGDSKGSVERTDREEAQLVVFTELGPPGLLPFGSEEHAAPRQAGEDVLP